MEKKKLNGLLKSVKNIDSVRNIADNIKLISITKHEDPTLNKVTIEIDGVEFVLFANWQSKLHFDKNHRFKHFRVSIDKRV